MRTTALLIATLTTSLATGCMVGDEGEQAESGREVIGGVDDLGDPAVGMVRVVTETDIYGKPTNGSICTATVIAPNVMLTAAHCLDYEALWTDVLFGQKPNFFAPLRGWENFGTIIRHPLYNGDGSNGHDVAIVILGRPVSVTPIQRGVTPAVGASVTAVGYGTSSFAQTGIGSKRKITFPVNAVSATVISAGSEGHNVCHGDSGGPVLSNGRVVGVNDWVDTADCHGGGHMGRVDVNLDFIRTYAPNF